MPKRLVTAVALLVLVSLAFVGWRANVVNLRGVAAWSVAVAFDDPPPGRGTLVIPGGVSLETSRLSRYIWVKDGRAVPANELVAFGGPEHCHWEAAAFIHIGWPPGTFAETMASARQYVRDPRGVIAHDPSLRDRFARAIALPPDAKPTGYRLGSIELYLSPSDQDRWIYLVSPADVERWPRSDPPTACM